MDASLQGKNELLSKYAQYVEDILEKLTIVNIRLAENKGELAKEKAKNMGIYPPYRTRYQSSDNGIAQQFLSSTAIDANCLNSETTDKNPLKPQEEASQTTSDLESAKVTESHSESHKKIKAQRLKKKIYSRLNCDICRKSFKSKRLINKHAKEEHQEVHSSFNCDICHKSFKSKNSIYQHLRGVHQEVNSPVDCDVCHKSFKSRNSIYHHVKGAHQEGVHSSLYIRCDICKIKVKGKQGLKVHTREVHSEVRFRCRACLKSLKSARCFRAHFQKIHKGGKHLEMMGFAEEYIPKSTDKMPTLERQI
ncbi:zinc finger protein 319-like [Belonocnema kinseyi]|uniref:zinc finger protein 319-like n=1 Tax=Belonocnema kinseyi TaxID=2817044 RepID=UPI00143DC46F|nr:zinc finger protein 319-like [Belonocnema kinseyi]